MGEPKTFSCHWSFVIGHFPFVIGHLLVICHLSLVMCYLLFTIGYRSICYWSNGSAIEDK